MTKMPHLHLYFPLYSVHWNLASVRDCDTLHKLVQKRHGSSHNLAILYENAI